MIFTFGVTAKLIFFFFFFSLSEGCGGLFGESGVRGSFRGTSLKIRFITIESCSDIAELIHIGWPFDTQQDKTERVHNFLPPHFIWCQSLLTSLWALQFIDPYNHHQIFLRQLPMPLQKRHVISSISCLAPTIRHLGAMICQWMRLSETCGGPLNCLSSMYSHPFNLPLSFILLSFFVHMFVLNMGVV